ncbi:sulfurtransferase complex subunit TusD [Candidatus Palibaumannia cicadellinicola]|uniref:Intracellular sulfur reduction protein DsrE n=1 Tax=Baumannia cicadellinicola subsp. Homalodisca coagulata TaxID=374463 RepID=Q1LSZ0_BAUCH|nr:sulfurtransferase complex subunit TusD [Candidatus Baumannia cicadellinicola]ABF14361.1 intracellular sulfur reduction protein DsrE [Baumannia cicadellinicola str. Hc (Homalodisca coagulata)]MBS0032759.1 sulfurtransferase complex subunit TusD [Candidatus Baumannia cicadellinicola]MCJ7462038.1 sulfurtransferase complex subunit TusD [Candidatus Baumannia cicadellinicola]MCJ7463065.1 sulfurtransferase complex subunit TusD [Candidatus Baumannia cicadellinicola]
MITGPAYGNQRASSALQFAQALLNYGHYIKTIFFYQDGVYNANKFITPASDEKNLLLAWEKLAIQHKVSLHICITAALRRGIIDDQQARELNLSGFNLHSTFKISSLSYFGQAVLHCDRLIQF